MILREGITKAKKFHRCDGAWWIGEADDPTLPKHICNGIKAGQEYFQQVHTYGGDFTHFKTCLSCRDYAAEHNIPLNDGY
jgi:hypothetical protein